MNSDGHTGIENKILKELHIKQFGLTLVFAALKDADGQTNYISHARSNQVAMSGPSVGELLSRIGYRHFPGTCVTNGDDCFWLPLASMRDNARDHWQAERVHSYFNKHAEKDLPLLLNCFQNIYRELGTDRSRKIDLFSELRSPQVPILEATGDGLPTWATEVMPDSFQKLEAEIIDSQAKYKKLLVAGGLLTETGERLEDSVVQVFRDLGFGAEVTEPGETYDLLVELDATRKLLIEVTGIDGSIKKKSNKISQALSVYQNIKTENDRIVIAVNCFRNLPLSERAGKEIITEDALKLLTPIEVNLITTEQLFEIWKLSLEDHEKAVSHIDSLYAQSGGIFQN